MAFTPDSEVRFLNVPLDSSYNNQLTFDTVAEQTAYFLSRQVGNAFSDVTYQRKDNVIRVLGNIDNYWNVNYVMYKNGNFPNKWFYAFVDKLTYVANETTHMHIETDVNQTWFFDYTLKHSFVEREHTNVQDSISVAEDLDTGNEYVCRHQNQLFQGNSHFIVTMKESITNILNEVNINKTQVMGFANCPSVMYHYLMDPGSLNEFFSFITNPVTPDEEAHYISEANAVAERPEPPTVSGTAIDSLANWFLSFHYNNITLPFWTLRKTLLEWRTASYTERSARLTTSIISIDRVPFDPMFALVVEPLGHRRVLNASMIGASQIQSLVSNNTFTEPKLNYYPYTYYKLTTHKGASQIFKPEYVGERLIVERIFGISGGNTRIRYTVKNYHNNSNMKDMSVMDDIKSSLPVLNDAYGVYMMGNKNSDEASQLSGVFGGLLSMGFGASMAMGAGGVVGGALMMVGGVASAGMGIGSKLAKQQDMRNIPPTVTGSTGNASFEMMDNENGVWVEKWTINDQHVNILTDYFHKYGYKVNRFKVPNRKTRDTFNYVKTSEVNITGNIPDEDMLKLKTMYNNGVTFWHIPSLVGEYA